MIVHATNFFNTKKKGIVSKEIFVLIVSIFLAGLCSIIYELLISTASSYFLGDSIKQFSITIGLYMAAMGMGSYVSRKIKTDLFSWFIGIEILLGCLGGICIPVLYFCYSFTDIYYPVMVCLILAIGLLIGLEIPLLTRIMEKYYPLKINISNVLSLDYLGALLATIAFPFILLPVLGIFKSSLFFGIVNMGLGFLNLWCFQDKLENNRKKLCFISAAIVTLFLILTFTFSGYLLEQFSKGLYQDRIIFSKQTKFQKIVLTKNKEDIRMFLDGNLQFSTIDEYRYHESIIHIPFTFAKSLKNILILGGGDGLCVREILKYPDVEKIVIVDIDPEIIRISKKNHHLKKINKNSLNNRRVKIINRDAFIFVKNQTSIYDIIISDLPDPNNTALARMYSKEFYSLVSKILSKDGVFICQATSPFFAKNAFWCINNTISSANFITYPYHVYIPSFGDWGFIMAAKSEIEKTFLRIDINTKYIDNKILSKAFVFPKDLNKKETKLSTLDKPVILDYYMQGWKYWN